MHFPIRDVSSESHRGLGESVAGSLLFESVHADRARRGARCVTGTLANISGDNETVRVSRRITSAMAGSFSNEAKDGCDTR
jgi:hypothetical protein